MPDDILKEAKDCFQLAVEAESENRKMWLDDFRFGRLGEQWPEQLLKERLTERRPALTINRLPSFMRQIVNDSRQNKPQIKVKPVDDNADVHTANMLSGLVRNIEYSSNADVAYDTAIEHAVGGGFGYIRVDVDYSYDDSFDKELRIKRVANPLTIYGDPYSTEADSCDWDTSFVVDYMPKDEFKKKYKGAANANWDGYAAHDLPPLWEHGENVLVAEFWKREEYQAQLLLVQPMDGGQPIAIKEDVFKSKPELQGLPVLQQRPIKCYKINHHVLTGAEVLETNEWAGKYIPIIPVYGEEINIEGKRYFRSLIRDAKDAQRMLNYWRTAATELVALAPRVPWLLEEKSLNIDPVEAAKWNTANQISHNYLMYKGAQPPTRLPLDSGTAAGAMTEALQASDDMKNIMGMQDASLGIKSNETSGRAIMARQQEGDVSTFHFIDNLSRAIRHTGCVLLDMIPHVYTGERVVRVLGEDGTPQNAKLGQGMQPPISSGPPPPPGMPAQMPGQPPQMQQPMPGQSPVPGAQPQPKFDPNRIYDISVGKYDVAVETGPGFTTRREEAASQMTEFIRAVPQAAPIIGDYIIKAMDWPHADEMAERVKLVNPALQNEILTPELKQQIQEGQQKLQQQDIQIQSLKAGNDVKMAELQVKQQELEVKQQELQVQQYEAETARIAAINPAPIVTAPQKAA